ncbi:receptor-like protein 19 [Hibiscus syriacus]|uniref:receptor-like protein 19 n=1 Tax=Hibiscus syriacus TaxID=106335 RepID=UPI00192506D2|nr:receptor-like protein 19 [Hibiscus syriacus]
MAKTSFLLPLMFLLLFANYGAIFSVNSSNATTDQSALLELKSHISHDPYNLLATNWSTSISVCDWIGITGGSRHHRVTALNLSSMDFRGTIPSQLGSLSFLASLDFRHNSFHGSLPTELANLHQLKYLNFGPIPPVFQTLTSLIYLFLFQNKLTGRVPSPPPSLQLYDVSENNLAGEFPASLCNLSALSVLNLNNNSLGGTIPKCIGNFSSSLLEIDLRNNNFHVSFTCLRVIDLSHNNFSGYLPTKIFENLHTIKEGLKMDYMIDRMTDGTMYYVDGLSFGTKGLEMEFHSLLTIWMVIGFSNNQFFGEIPETIGELHSLIVLNLSHNCLTGPIPCSLGELSELESLDLSSNNLHGRIPTELKNLGFLAVLNLSQNNLTGHIPQGKQF